MKRYLLRDERLDDVVGDLVEALVERDALLLEAGGRGRLVALELLHELARFRFGRLRAAQALLELGHLGLGARQSGLRLGQSLLSINVFINHKVKLNSINCSCSYQSMFDSLLDRKYRKSK